MLFSSSAVTVQSLQNALDAVRRIIAPRALSRFFFLVPGRLVAFQNDKGEHYLA